MRQRRLMLETIYGGGPRAIPFAYEAEKLGEETEAKKGGNRTRLRLHRAEPRTGSDSVPPHCGTKRDIPRARLTDLSGPPPAEGHFYDALIADARNDDHLIISQLTVVFHLLHNWIDQELRKEPEGKGTDSRSATWRFDKARRLTAFLFRRVLFGDYLGRILCPEVHAHFEAGNRLERTEDTRTTLEFAHGAFRVGHVMVRRFYPLNKTRVGSNAYLGALFDRTSNGTSRTVPHQDDWWVRWSALFEIGELLDAHDHTFPEPSESNPILPDIVPELSRVKALRFPVEGGGEAGLIYQDFRRSALSGLRSVASLADRIGGLLPAEIVDAAPLFDQAAREATLRAWLTDHRTGHDRTRRENAPNSARDLTDPQIECLVSDPPLLFFILLEASVYNENQEVKGLGPLGSAIVAETFYAARDRTEALIEKSDEIHSFAVKLFGDSVPKRMPVLIKELAERVGLSDPGCRFL